MHPTDDRLQRFQVKIGHAVVIVQSHSAEDAVEQAKRLLRLEMPRMWDVIESLEVSRFQVNPTA